MMDQAQIDAERAAIVAEALTWRGTVYHDGPVAVKGVGADCLTFLAGAFTTLLGPIEVPHYSPQWHLHHSRELYVEGILKWGGVEVAGPEDRPPLPGDIVLFKQGRCFAHGAIVTQWPIVIHAYSKRPVGHDDASKGALARYFEQIPEKGDPRAKRLFTLSRWL